jgi:hypothetical protein
MLFLRNTSRVTKKAIEQRCPGGTHGTKTVNRENTKRFQGTFSCIWSFLHTGCPYGTMDKFTNVE